MKQQLLLQVSYACLLVNGSHNVLVVYAIR
jgi:hypothetical protein